MQSLAITNIGTIISGDLDRSTLPGDTILVEEGKIARVGLASQMDLDRAQGVIDAQGTVVAPGLIDSHFHVVLGDYQPRQKVVDFIESYVHGGITTMISAGEIHTPGRPQDAAGVRALAITAQRSFSRFRPGGAKVHAGCVIVEPTLTEGDFQELAREGVWLAKYGFGAFSDPYEGEAHIRWAQRHGFKVTCHTGGASIPGSSPITADHLVRLRPDVCGHVNGGPTALPEEHLERLILGTDLFLQIVQAGNLRSALLILKLAQEHGALHRVILGSDTPTGTGVIPLGILKSVVELASLGGLPAAKALALATGNNARAFGLNAGLIAPGRDADLIILDAPSGSAGQDALHAVEIGDIPGLSACVIDGQVRLMRSRNTPPARRMATQVR